MWCYLLRLLKNLYSSQYRWSNYDQWRLLLDNHQLFAFSFEIYIACDNGHLKSTSAIINRLSRDHSHWYRIHFSIVVSYSNHLSYLTKLFYEIFIWLFWLYWSCDNKTICCNLFIYITLISKSYSGPRETFSFWCVFVSNVGNQHGYWYFISGFNEEFWYLHNEPTSLIY